MVIKLINYNNITDSEVTEFRKNDIYWELKFKQYEFNFNLLDTKKMLNSIGIITNGD